MKNGANKKKTELELITSLTSFSYCLGMWTKRKDLYVHLYKKKEISKIGIPFHLWEATITENAFVLYFI